MTSLSNIILLVCVGAGCLSQLILAQQPQPGILYPQESESRQVKSLDGIWNFRLAPRLQPDLGFLQNWYAQELRKSGDVDLMPVPSSYNDITQSKEVRDHVGWVWYDRTFWIPNDWQSNQRIFLRVGAAHYHAIVYVNGEKVVEHSGGALPFVVELGSPPLKFETANRITIALNNTLTQDTLPQGSVVWQTGPKYPEGYFTLDYIFDFFNYAGLHRSIFLYTTPKTYIDDIDVVPSVSGTTGRLSYSVKTNTDSGDILTVKLQDKDGVTVVTADGAEGELVVPNARLWWPFTMVQNDSDAGYQYDFVATLTTAGSEVLDVYRLKVGIRSVAWNEKQFLINNKPFYFRGYGRHEDFNIRGRGIDNVMNVKDHNLIKWTGANSYRTSHYPYSEEIMDLTDSLGIAIIDEAPAVFIDGFGTALLENHKQSMRDLIQRDKNRPSVVMWSVSNEARSNQDIADNYYNEIVALTKLQDASKRPITAVTDRQYAEDRSAKYVDILAVNRYFSWYSDTGHTEVIEESMTLDIENWVRTYNKPVMISEYGADTVPGLHMSPEFVFTEEYQTQFMREHFKSFDFLRQNSSLIGEHIWNFADFMTQQGITRITGNRKGVFTRERQPKAAAHLLRHRYHLLASESDNYPIPSDLLDTTPIYNNRARKVIHDEH